MDLGNIMHTFVSEVNHGKRDTAESASNNDRMLKETVTSIVENSAQVKVGLVCRSLEKEAVVHIATAEIIILNLNFFKG